MQNGITTLENTLLVSLKFTHLPDDPLILLLGIHAREVKADIHINTWTRMFIAFLFVIETGNNSDVCH